MPTTNQRPVAARTAVAQTRGLRTKQTRKATATNNVAVIAPDVAALWSPNNPVGPDQVHPGTGTTYEFMCPVAADHVWLAAVKSLTGAGTGCPACSNKQLSVTNRLDLLHPDLALEWHPTLNGDRSAADYVHGSGVAAFWRCARGHSYEKTIVKRTRNGHDCAQCRIEDRSIAAVAPHLVSEWCPDSNGTRSPTEVAAGSTTPVTWRCAQNHRWPASPDNRRRGNTGCPDCSNLRATPEYNLATEHPAVASGYHPDLNTVPATEVHPRSETPRYFVCATNPAHVWLTQPLSRTRPAGSGCPVCNRGGWTLASVAATLAALLLDGTVEDLSSTERAVLFHTLTIDQVSDPETRNHLGTFVAGKITLDDVYLAVGNDPAELARVKEIRAARCGAADLGLPANENGDPDDTPEEGLRAIGQQNGNPFDEHPGADARAILRPLTNPTILALTVEGQALDTLLHTRVDAL